MYKIYFLVIEDAYRNIFLTNNCIVLPAKVVLFGYFCKISYYCGSMKNQEKKFYRIGDVAEILGISISTLRFWEKKFTVIKPKRTSGNTRYYTLDDIEKIKLVYYLVKEKGLKLEAAEQEIKQNRQNVSKKHEVVERLKEIRESLLLLERSLNAIS